MKSFLLNTFLFLLIYLGGLFVLYKQPYKIDNFFHSVAAKHERLEKDIPQIILVGGSNTLFGIDSKMIVDATNYDVVNMGIHMGLGYYYQTEEIIDDLQKDDIVILIPEYVNVFEEKHPNERMLNQLIEYYPKAICTFKSSNRLKILYNHFLDKIRKNIAYIEEGLDFDIEGKDGYSLSGVNEFGDQTDHLKVKKGIKLGRWNMNKYNGADVHPTFIQQTQKVINKCVIQDCQVFVSFPSLAQSAYDEKVAEKYSKVLDELGFQKIGEPKTFVFKNKEFYDTFYHPLKKARRWRTQKLINRIKKKTRDKF